jgi:cytoskeletal protein CcmA (bactofilin family)
VSAYSVSIGRRGEVVGSIHADEVEIGERAKVEDVHAKRIIMEEKAQARNLYGETISIESDCSVSGEVQYTQSLRTERNVFFAKTPVKIDKLPQ